jgi:hypothetical protein
VGGGGGAAGADASSLFISVCPRDPPSIRLGRARLSRATSSAISSSSPSAAPRYWAGGLDAVRFLALPVLLSLLSRLGTEGRLYRAMFLEEIGRDYVRTARAKGLGEAVVLGRHVLRDARDDRFADDDAAAVELVEAGDLPQQSGLAATGRPENRHELAVADVERDFVERAERAERLGDAIDDQPRHGSTPLAGFPVSRVESISAIVTATVSIASAAA